MTDIVCAVCGSTPVLVAGLCADCVRLLLLTDHQIQAITDSIDCGNIERSETT